MFVFVVLGMVRRSTAVALATPAIARWPSHSPLLVREGRFTCYAYHASVVVAAAAALGPCIESLLSLSPKSSKPRGMFSLPPTWVLHAFEV